MRENRLSGSEGGGAKSLVALYPYPRVTVNAVARSAGCHYFLDYEPGGSAALHPRLYAVARCRGLGRGIHR